MFLSKNLQSQIFPNTKLRTYFPSFCYNLAILNQSLVDILSFIHKG